jgi:hypothetical protein
MNDLTDPPLTIPAETQVVTRGAVRKEAGVELAPAGAVGIVVAAFLIRARRLMVED